ncbi:MAG: LuxR C-terminal-related transcriptional regulator [Oliverpabstia sp.]|nr:LuxR C-terminal-related transcriptional regulator [Oliverpabstia sp.]
MEKSSPYVTLTAEQFYIDKTAILERGMEECPSIYIEGAAASGKTTAVRLLLGKNPDMKAYILEMKEEAESIKKLDEMVKSREEWTKPGWIIFEDMHSALDEVTIKKISDCIWNLPAGWHAILIGRERPHEGFLNLIWKRKMQIISQEHLRFTEKDIRSLTNHFQSDLDPGEIYEQTGGWAGCVDMMLRLSQADPPTSRRNAREIKASYEITAYIKKYILDTLSAEENAIMRRAVICPWINETMCREIWQLPWASDSLQDLCRKGLLEYDKEKERWKIAPMFRDMDISETNPIFWKHLGNWYHQSGNVEEALFCLKKSQNEEAYRACMLQNYAKIPFLGIPYSEVMGWKETDPRLCYLRGVYCYTRQKPDGINLEIQNLNISEKDAHEKREIYLNLTFLKPDLDLDFWLGLLEQYSREKEHFHLYNILGNSHTYLCGVRDLSRLFACTKREENRKAKIWKEHLGKEEWKCYQLARIDYYLETERKDTIPMEDWELLFAQEDAENSRRSPWQQRLAKLYLLYKLQRLAPKEDHKEQISSLENSLMKEENQVCLKNTEAVSSLFAPVRNEQERLTRWLLKSDKNMGISVKEDNYDQLFCQVKGYLHLNQYKRSEKILRHLIPYLQFYRRNKYLAELLFQQAVIFWDEGLHGQALRKTIESFMVSGEARYVGFYTVYEKKGEEVLEEYIDWLSKNSPGGWHRKKKYNYGNVLRMPKEDYMEVVLRCARREARISRSAEEATEEHLTMMETIILQDINRGLTNAEICEELNLKLPTVKSHIYNLYKKLGVNSRVQAILKGKEQGILD